MREALLEPDDFDQGPERVSRLSIIMASKVVESNRAAKDGGLAASGRIGLRRLKGRF